MTPGTGGRLPRPSVDDLERIRAEEVLQRVRAACVAVAVVQSFLYPGDRPAVGWALCAFVALTWLVVRRLLARGLSGRSLGALGVGVMAADCLAVTVCLANLLGDPTDPVQMLPLIIAAEGAVRWGRWGGLGAGLLAGAMSAGWAVTVHARHDLSLPVAFVTFRVAIMVLVGGLLGGAISALHRQRRLSELIFHASHDLIGTFDMRGTIRAVNPACEAILGYRPEEVVGRNRSALVREAERPPELPDQAVYRVDGPSRLVELPFVHKDGHTVWLEVDLQADLGAGLVHVVGRDVSERRRQEHDLRHRADHDGLTGAANRAHLLASLHGALADGRTVALLFVDLDGFKAVNDRHGHRAGDEVLIETVGRLRAVVRAEDLVARLAGDEFCVLVREPGGAVAVAERVAAEAARRYDVGGVRVRLSASVGVATSEPGDGPEDLLDRADRAMYETKRAHRRLRLA